MSHYEGQLEEEEDDLYEDDFTCEWCDEYLCSCEEAARCICKSFNKDGHRIADCVCGA